MTGNTGNNDNSDKVSRSSKTIRLRDVRSKKEAKRKKSPFRTATFVLVLVFVLYIAAACFVGMRSNLSTTIALNGSVRENIRVSGYVFRDQNVISAPWDGHFECLVSEGERVNQGQVIGYIYHIVPDAETMDKIKKLHRAIRLSGTSGEGEYIAGGSGVTEKKISELARELSDKRSECNLSDAREKKEELNILIKNSFGNANRNNVNESAVGETGEEENEITNADRLKSKLAALERQAGESVKIVAEKGGVFSSMIDGYEDVLALDKADSVVPSDFGALDNIEKPVLQGVVAGQPLCKIINNYVWRYASVISEKEAENLTVGQNIQMRFYDLANGEIKGTVSRISEIENGKRAIVVSTNKYVDGIYSASRINADLVIVDSSGIKLPAGCLRVRDGVTGVYVIRLDTARFVPVNLIYRNDEWAIVSAAEPDINGYRLQIYDEVIVECKNLEDGKVVR